MKHRNGPVSISNLPETLLEARATLHRVAHQGCHVCWRQLGDGPPLMLLHGGHGSWLHWVRNIEALAGRYTVWVPDMPGYGDSDTPPEPTLDSLVAITMATLNQLVGDTARIRLAGFSFGGLVGAHLAAQRGRVHRLALLGPGGHGGQRRPSGELLSWRSAADSGDANALAGVMRHNLAAHMLHDPARIDALAVQVHTAACLNTRFYSKAISRSATLAGALDQCDGPVLLAWGEHDVTAQPEAIGRTLSAGRANCRTHVVADAGHWAQFEQPDAVNHLLLDWLGSD